MTPARMCREVYRSDSALLDLLRTAPEAEAWRIGGLYTSVRVGKRTYRRLFTVLSQLEELAEDLARAGKKPHPSSWGGVWREFGTYPSAPPPSAARLLDSLPCARRPSPWIEVRASEGFHGGAWQEWDLSSAYAWASAEGLPDMSTVTRGNVNCISDTGLYLIDGPLLNATGEPEPFTLPTWLRHSDDRVLADRPGLLDWRKFRRRHSRDSLAWVPGETMNRLGYVPKNRPRAALEWGRQIDMRPCLDDVRTRLPKWWKAVYRAHWGDWGSSTAVVREKWVGGMPVAANDLPQGLRAPLWSWSIQARVSVRVCEAADMGIRIFSDAAVTPEWWSPSNVGTEPGQWKRKETWADGINLHSLPWRPQARTGALRPMVANHRDGCAREKNCQCPRAPMKDGTPEFWSLLAYHASKGPKEAAESNRIRERYRLRTPGGKPVLSARSEGRAA